ncbi:hypothetical protein CK203_081875 [Vitis vinifera]|uniref:Uncharacterized protein n=1 Tax=Vitis vinifera TaxID=29760 RepID=A0A438EAU5_VITVI|nr:hypothetical protein CK203_081875 [Vitis vinifera]
MMYGAVMFPSRTLFHLYFSFTTSKEAWMDEEFIWKLYALRRSGKEDKMVRKASKSVEFLVKSFYSTLELDAIVSFPLKIVWDSWAPTKVVGMGVLWARREESHGE